MAKKEKARPDGVVHAANALISVALTTPGMVADADIEPSMLPLNWQQEVWRKVVELDTQGTAPDVVLVADLLQNSGIEIPDEGTWLSTLGKLVRDSSATSRNITAYANVILNWRRNERGSQVGQDLIEGALLGEDRIDDAVRNLMSLTSNTKYKDSLLSESMSEFMDELDRRHEKPGAPGLTTGLPKLDEGTGGLTKQHLIVLAARPSMGKTAMALNICASNFDKKVGFISTEQPRREMIGRLVSIVSGADAKRMRFGKCTDDDFSKIAKASSQIAHWPLMMSDNPKPHIVDIERLARKWKHRHGLEILFVDYLQRVRGEGRDRHVEVGMVARSLKNLARELDIPVVALCQISRAVESRDDKRPTLADLRESGDIEQEADLIITMYRDEVYNNDPSTKGKCEFGTPKNRHSSLGRFSCDFNGSCFRFTPTEFDQAELEGELARGDGSSQR